MKITRGIKRAVKPLVDIPNWMGAREVGDYGRAIYTAAKRLFAFPSSPPPESIEDFSAVLKRLGLTEADLARRAYQLTLMAYLFLSIGIGTFSYSIWLLIEGGFKGAVVSLAVTAFVFSLAFRNHFWLFQIKQRKLGCTFRDWLHNLRGLNK